MQGSPSRRWIDLAVPAASLMTLAGLGLALACTTTGAARPAVSAPPAPAVKAPAASDVAAAPAAAQSTLVVVGGESFNFGAIWPGDALKHSFILKNTGVAEVKILRVQPG